MKTWKKITLSIVTVFILVSAYLAYKCYHVVYVVIPNSYAAWTTGDLIVEYLKTHNDRWPQSWDDLREAKASIESRGDPIYWNFNALPKMVSINWNADPKELSNAQPLGNEIPFRVVAKQDGSAVDACWGEDTEPNRQIYKYLKKRKI